MSSQDRSKLDQFSGVARLFPLPNLVLFPNVVQPLHIFEPRYRQMMADALANDRLIGMGLLDQGSPGQISGLPVIHPVICLGHIFREERMPDGRFNFLLQGVARARIVEELPSGKLYREVRVELLHEVPAASGDQEEELRQTLMQRVSDWFIHQPAAQTQLKKLFKGSLTLGMLCDVLGFALPLPLELKQELLEMVDIEERANTLLTSLEENSPPEAEDEPAPKPAQRFPPDFSLN
jgi:Lon protease-like protein